MKQKSAPCTSKAGFERTNVQCSNDTTCIIYKRCATELFFQKIRNTKQNNIILQHSRHETATDPLKAIIVSGACKALEEKEKWSSDSQVMWSTFDNYGQTSCVGCAHVFGDKSQTSLSSSAVLFYSHCLTLLNFSKHQRGKLIRQELTVLAYHSVPFWKIQDTCRTRADQMKNPQLFWKYAPH